MAPVALVEGEQTVIVSKDQTLTLTTHRIIKHHPDGIVMAHLRDIDTIEFRKSATPAILAVGVLLAAVTVAASEGRTVVLVLALIVALLFGLLYWLSRQLELRIRSKSGHVFSV